MLAPSYYFTRPIWCSPRKLTSSGRPRSMDETINGETDANRRAAAILEGVIGQSGCSAAPGRFSGSACMRCQTCGVLLRSLVQFAGDPKLQPERLDELISHSRPATERPTTTYTKQSTHI